ncbi:MAG: hypothetical protein FJ109_00745 [Deltaproteobacteria bacterium]|nr:hypothetical protein [Deltaproteobacteria bacterium]
MNRTSAARSACLVAALTALLFLSSGCEVVVFYYLTEGDDEESSGTTGWDNNGWDDWEPPAPIVVTCGSDGLWAEGTLAVTAQEPVSNQTAESVCTWYSIDYFADRYEACCRGECCSWGVGVSGSSPLAGKGDWCYWSGMCAPGLSCFELDGNRAESGGTCRQGHFGEWCDTFHTCEGDLYCPLDEVASNGSLEGICRYHVAVEGEKCQPAPIESCLAPMKCTCPGEGDCKCWDGSKGDPCKVDSSCMVDLKCLKMPDGQMRCGKSLPVHSPCDPESLQAACEPGTVCNTAFEPPECRLPGHIGDACLRDEECTSDLFCFAETAVCVGGEAGSPCVTPADCKNGATCLVDDSGGHCVFYLGGGDACALDIPYEVCLPGLVCRSAVAGGETTCLPPGTDWDPCADDSDCETGFFCIGVLFQCFDGRDGDPCSQDAHCAPGWHCPLELAHCYDGSTGDPCWDDDDCAAGLLCDPDLDACYAGTHGVPCTSSKECGPGLACVPVGEFPVCFEFLPAGAPCGAAGLPFSACDVGLVCDDSLESPVCAEPGAE